jgi:hypothetical protein
MPNVRLIPPSVGALNCVANGRTYTGVAGATLDVPDFDAAVLTANGWTVSGEVGATAVLTANGWTVSGEVGATAGRPLLNRGDRGREFVDTTLAAVIRWDGKAWRNKITGASA